MKFHLPGRPDICMGNVQGINLASGEPPLWTALDLRARLAHAADTLNRLPNHGARPAQVMAHWPEVAHGWLAYAWEHTKVRRTAPTPDEIDQMDATLGWLWLLTRDQRMILFARAQHWSWPKISDLDGRGERQLRRIRDDGEARILAHLNGTTPRMRVTAEMLRRA